MSRTIASTLLLTCLIACSEIASTNDASTPDAAAGDESAEAFEGGSSEEETDGSAGASAEDGASASELTTGSAGASDSASAAEETAGAAGESDGAVAIETTSEADDAYAEGSAEGAADSGNDTISFSEVVAPILKTKCAHCHDGKYGVTASAYTHLKGITTSDTECHDRARITVGDGVNSLLIQKLRGTPSCGTQMPQVNRGSDTIVDCSGSECVPGPEIDKISAWIDQGALNN